MKIFQILTALLFSTVAVVAQAQTPGYGANITLAQAKVVLAAAEAEAVKQNFTVAVAVVDTAGNLVAFSKGDNTQIASVNISQGKAYTAVGFKRPTKALQDTIAAGGVGLRTLTLEGVVAAEGGVPLVLNGQIVGHDVGTGRRYSGCRRGSLEVRPQERSVLAVIRGNGI